MSRDSRDYLIVEQAVQNRRLKAWQCFAAGYGRRGLTITLGI